MSKKRDEIKALAMIYDSNANAFFSESSCEEEAKFKQLIQLDSKIKEIYEKIAENLAELSISQLKILAELIELSAICEEKDIS